jgi:hypothetical protein
MYNYSLLYFSLPPDFFDEPSKQITEPSSANLSSDDDDDNLQDEKQQKTSSSGLPSGTQI